MKNIQIGKVRIPIDDYAVSCNAILGIRDSGKTVTAKGIAEQLLDASVPIVVFDAVGKWRWLKVARPGGKGYKVVVAGGRQPDIELNPKSVAEIVRASVRERIPLVIDLYDPKLSKADWRRIVQQSIRIIHYEANGLAHVFLEEAAEYCPQRVTDGETFAEVEKLARMGGNASVGITLINQRSQEIAKSVLDLSHNLILGCQIGNKAIEAIEKWVDRLSPEIAKELTTSLPHLKSGEAWVWTRSNPDHPTREKIAMCRSLHPDRRSIELDQGKSASIDTSEFINRMNEAIPKIIEESKSNDPATLKKEIAALKRKISEQKPIEKEVSVITEEDRCMILELHEKLNGVVDELSGVRELVQKVGLTKQKAPVRSIVTKPVSKPVQEFKNFTISRPEENGFPDGERKILEALIQFPDGLERNQLTVLTGYKRSTRDAYIQRLRSRNYVDTNSNLIKATDEGFGALPDAKPLPTGPELQSYWLQRLPSGEAAIFQFLLSQYPQCVTRETISENTGFKRSTRDAYIQRMVAKMIVSLPLGGYVKASDNLFL